MPAKLVTTVSKIAKVPNETNAALIQEFYRYLKFKGSSENNINNNLKTTIAFANFLGPDIRFFDLKKEDVIRFLETKEKTTSEDPEQARIGTWNHYLRRIKLFSRWLYNVRVRGKSGDESSQADWETPDYVKIRDKKTRRLSPYSETEIWDRDELITIIKYEAYKRNKAALALMWDLYARNHEIALLKIKNIRLKESYGEGEIPSEAKTGSGPILLTLSFPYVRDWLNEHPQKNSPDARRICNLYTGRPIRPEALWTMMKQLRKRIERLLDNGTIRHGRATKVRALAED